MSWDVVLQNARVAVDSNEAADAGSASALGSADSVRALISEVHRRVDWNDPTWGVLDGDRWSIEFNLGDSQTTDSIMLHVRGRGDPLPAITAICKRTGWTAFDSSSGELLDLQNPSPQGWLAFQAFRDELQSLAEVRDASTLRRSGLKLEGATLVRSHGRNGDERFELRSFSEVRLGRGTNWASVLVAVVSLGIAILLKIVVPIVWLGWLSFILLAGVGLLFVSTARTDTLLLKTTDGSIVLPLVDTPAEVRAFHSLLTEALSEAANAETMPHGRVGR